MKTYEATTSKGRKFTRKSKCDYRFCAVAYSLADGSIREVAFSKTEKGAVGSVKSKFHFGVTKAQKRAARAEFDSHIGIEIVEAKIV